MSNFFNTARGFKIGDTVLIFGEGTPDIVLTGQTIPDGALYINGDNFDGYKYDEGMASWEIVSVGISGAADLVYNNDTSGLLAEDVQAAIDELATLGGGGGETLGTHDATGTFTPPNPDPTYKSSVGSESLVGGTWTADFLGGGAYQETTFQIFNSGNISQETITIHGVTITIPAYSSLFSVMIWITEADYSSATTPIISVTQDDANTIRIVYGSNDPTAPDITSTGPTYLVSNIQTPIAVFPLSSIQYHATDYMWDKLSKVTTIKYTEPFNFDTGHFLAFTTDPLNFESHLNEVIAEGGITVNEPELFIYASAGYPLEDLSLLGIPSGSILFTTQAYVNGDLVQGGFLTLTEGTSGVDLFLSANSNNSLLISARDITTGVSTSLFSAVGIDLNAITTPPVFFVGSTTAVGVEAMEPSFTVDYGAARYTEGDINVENHTVARFETFEDVSFPPAPSEGVYRITGQGKVGGTFFGEDDILRVYANSSIYKYGNGIVRFNNTPLIDLNDIPLPVSPSSGGIDSGVNGVTWTADFAGGGANPLSVQYQTLDYVWDLSNESSLPSSVRASLKTTEIQDADVGHFLIFTTNPENIDTDLIELFTGSQSPSSGTELFLGLLIGNFEDPNFLFFTIAYRDGDEEPSFGEGLTTNQIGKTLTLYLSLQGTNLTASITDGTSEFNLEYNGQDATPNIIDISYLTLPLKPVVGTLTLTDTGAQNPSIDLDYVAGDVVGTTWADANSSTPHLPLMPVIFPPLKAGIYESDINQTINGIKLKFGEMFLVKPDNTNIEILSPKDTSDEASCILYIPNAIDTLGQYGKVPEHQSPFKANSFEEAVVKSNLQGKLPIVIDTNFQGAAGADIAVARIKSYSDTNPSYYDLTNITVWSRDAWLAKDTDYLIKSMDFFERNIAIDQGVVIQYGKNSTGFLPDYNDALLFGDGRRVQGWVGFQFKQTNEVISTEIPDPLNYTQVQYLIDFYTHAANTPPGIPLDSQNTLLLWTDSGDGFPIGTPNLPYSSRFLNIIPGNVPQFGSAHCFIDIQLDALDSVNGLIPTNQTVSVNISEGSFDDTGQLYVNFIGKVREPSAVIFAEGETEGSSDNNLSKNEITLDLNIQENSHVPAFGEGLILRFHPKENTTIRIPIVPSDLIVYQNGIEKFGVGRLHINSITGLAQTLDVTSSCPRDTSGVTWSSSVTATINITHNDTVRAYGNVPPIFQPAVEFKPASGTLVVEDGKVYFGGVGLGNTNIDVEALGYNRQGTAEIILQRPNFTTITFLNNAGSQAPKTFADLMTSGNFVNPQNIGTDFNLASIDEIRLVITNASLIGVPDMRYNITLHNRFSSQVHRTLIQDVALIEQGYAFHDAGPYLIQGSRTGMTLGIDMNRVVNILGGGNSSGGMRDFDIVMANKKVLLGCVKDIKLILTGDIDTGAGNNPKIHELDNGSFIARSNNNISGSYVNPPNITRGYCELIADAPADNSSARLPRNVDNIQFDNYGYVKLIGQSSHWWLADVATWNNYGGRIHIEADALKSSLPINLTINNYMGVVTVDPSQPSYSGTVIINDISADGTVTPR